MNQDIIRRWRDIALLAFFGVAAALLFDLLAQPFAMLFDNSPGWLYYLVTGVLVVGVLTPILHLMRPSWQHLRFVLFYPPIFLAPLLSIPIVWFLHFYSGIGPAYTICDWGIGTAILVIIAIAVTIYISPVPTDTATESLDIGDLTNWEDLRAWISVERPIKMTTEDGFQRVVIGQRVARRILESVRKRQLVSTGLIGAFGSGKTSLLNVIDRELHKQRDRATDPHIWPCRVSCWGFDNSAGALSHVLAKIVAEMNKHVDSLSLRSLPENYRRALSAGGSWWHVLAEGFSHSNNPEEQLKRLDPILQAVNARIIIAVEDVDRNESRTFDLQQIQAMLHLLRELKAVTFILCVGSTQQGSIDFAKLCENIESLPGIHWDELIPILKLVRSKCMTDGDFIDPAPDGLRESFERTFLRLLHLYEAFQAASAPDEVAESRALLSLLKTPRALKHALRDVLDTWSQLKGEIDFDDLLVANALRHGAPEAFDFMLEHVHVLRQNYGDQLDEKKQAGLDRLRERYQAIWQEISNDAEWRKEHARELIFYLIPNARQVLGRGRPVSNEEPPQGVRHKEPTDYWERILAKEIPEGEVHDQEILNLIDKANNGELSELATRLQSDNKCLDVWEHFSGRMNDNRLLDLAGMMIDLLLEKHGNRANIEDGLAVIHSVPYRRKSELSNPSDWLTEQVTKTLPRSVQFCNDLYSRLASTQSAIVDTGDRDTIRESIYETAQREFTPENIDRFIKALSQEAPSCLFQLVFVSADKTSPSKHTEPTDWQWLAPVVIDAISLSPQIMVPQLMHLVGRITTVIDRGVRDVYEIDEQLVLDLFPDQEREVYQALTRAVTVGSGKPQSYLEAAGNQAQRWLDENQ